MSILFTISLCTVTDFEWLISACDCLPCVHLCYCLTLQVTFFVNCGFCCRVSPLCVFSVWCVFGWLCTSGDYGGVARWVWWAFVWISIVFLGSVARCFWFLGDQLFVSRLVWVTSAIACSNLACYSVMMMKQICFVSAYVAVAVNGAACDPLVPGSCNQWMHHDPKALRPKRRLLFRLDLSQNDAVVLFSDTGLCTMVLYSRGWSGCRQYRHGVSDVCGIENSVGSREHSKCVGFCVFTVH